MSEIEKLRKRLKNVGRNVTQYNMTVAEAWALAEEFDQLEKEMQSQLADLSVKVEQWKIARTPDVPLTVIKNIDGGSF
jgi:hypothetical protein